MMFGRRNGTTTMVHLAAFAIKPLLELMVMMLVEPRPMSAPVLVLVVVVR
jgi:hypothetical protein